MHTIVYPGTFDPITLGHHDVASRAARLFDRVIIAVAEDVSGKTTLFDTDERIELAKKVFAGESKVQVVRFSGLLAEFCKTVSAQAVLRGIRTVKDFEYEFQIAYMNRHLNPDLESIFLAPAERFSFISSTLVREVASLGGNVDEFIHPEVAKALSRKFEQGK